MKIEPAAPRLSARFGILARRRRRRYRLPQPGPRLLLVLVPSRAAYCWCGFGRASLCFTADAVERR